MSTDPEKIKKRGKDIRDAKIIICVASVVVTVISLTYLLNAIYRVF